MSGPSEAARRAAHDSLDAVDGRNWAGATRTEVVTPILEAACDPVLGLERLVRLRDIYEAVRAEHFDRATGVTTYKRVSGFIERTFGEANG